MPQGLLYYRWGAGAAAWNMGKLSGLNQYGHSKWGSRSSFPPYWKRTTLTSLASLQLHTQKKRGKGTMIDVGKKESCRSFAYVQWFTVTK